MRSQSTLPSCPEMTKLGGLPHVHLLLEVTIVESGLDIHVMDTPPLLGSEHEENADRLDVSHGCERIIVNDPLLLDEATRDEPHLVLDHHPSLVLLELEHPLQSDQAVARRQVDELPRTVVLNGVHLLLHCGTPGHVTLGFGEGARFHSVHQVKLGVDVALHTPWHQSLRMSSTVW
jgi:hypothetical protein